MGRRQSRNLIKRLPKIPEKVEKSLGIFSLSNPIRKACMDMTEWPMFDKFVTFVIVANSVTLATTDYAVVDSEGEPTDKGSTRNAFVAGSEPVFTWFFTFECIVKVIASGLIMGSKLAYLRDPWNKLDFLVVVAGIVAMLPNMPNLSPLRTVRVLRPLRSLAKFPGLRRLVSSLLNSLPGLFNVIILLVFVFCIMGILGNKLFSGVLHARCRLTPYPLRLDMAEFRATPASWPSEFGWTAEAPDAAEAIVAGMDDDELFPHYEKAGVLDPTYWRCLEVSNNNKDWKQNTSPWQHPQECYWPLDIADTRVCSLGGFGSHECNLVEDENAADGSGVSQRWCGSNYDDFGNSRFVNSLFPYGVDRVESGTFLVDMNWGYTDFDSIGKAFLTIFQTITLEGWSDVMYMCQDSYHALASALVFMFLVGFGSFFMLNLVLAVISDSVSSLKEEEEEEASAAEARSMAEAEIEHRHAAAQAARVQAAQNSESGAGDAAATTTPSGRRLSDPNSVKSQHGASPDGRLKRRGSASESAFPDDDDDVVAEAEAVANSSSVTRLVMDRRFSSFIIVLILFNTVVLSMDHYPMDAGLERDLEAINFALSIAFMVEMVLKLAGLGPRRYAKDSFNLFDAFIVITGLVELIVAPPTFMSNGDTEPGGGGISALRTFRLFRVFKLAREWQSLQVLLKTIVRTLGEVANFGVLLILFMYIYSLVGMQFFANKLHFNPDTGAAIRYGAEGYHSAEVPRSHFDDILAAFVTIFQVLTGENWNSVMYDCRRAVGWGASVYFVSLVVIGGFIIMNLFLAILLSNFEGNEDLISKRKEEMEQENAERPVVLEMKAVAAFQQGPSRSRKKLEQSGCDESEPVSKGKATSGARASVGSAGYKVHPGPGEADEVQAPSSRGEEKTGSDGERGAAADNVSATVAPAPPLNPVQAPLPQEAPPAGSGGAAPPAVNSGSRSGIGGTGAGGTGGPPMRGQGKTQEVGVPQAPGQTQVSEQAAGQGADAAGGGTAQARPEAPRDSNVAPEASAKSAPKTSGHSARKHSAMVLGGIAGTRRHMTDATALTPPLKPEVPGALHELEDKEHELNDEQALTLVGLEVPSSSPSAPTPDPNAPPPISGVSLWLFPADHPVRQTLGSYVRTPVFDNVILGLIIISSVTLAIDNPLSDPDSALVKVLNVLDIVMTVLFTAEMMVKIVIRGFALHSTAYIRNSWNVLDLVIVVVSILSLALADVKSLKSLRSLRTLRVLRPLRMIARRPGLRLVVNALFSSIPAILNVLFVCMLFFLIFGIVGVNYFKGTFAACQGDVFDGLDAAAVAILVSPPAWSQLDAAAQAQLGAGGEWDCPIYYNAAPGTDITSHQVCTCMGAVWGNTVDQNFNNIFAGLSTLFQMSTTEGWVDIMFAGVDMTLPEMQPIRDNGREWILFYVLFMLVGCFFVMNLFVGVIIDNFNRIKDANNGEAIFLTDSQREWVKTQETLLTIRPLRKQTLPDNPIRAMAVQVVTHPNFDPFIMGCIATNTLVMGMDYFGQPNLYTVVLENINLVFAAIFLMEAIVKIVGLGTSYFSDGWNQFDFSIVLGTTAGIIFKWLSGSNIGSVATVVRTFRVGRILRLIQGAASLRQLFNTLMLALPSLGNIGSLLFLMSFIYAVMGVQLFATVAYNGFLNEHANFRDFWTAMLVLLRASTGENWNGIMYSMIDRTDGCVDAPEFNPDWCTENDVPGCTPVNGCGTPAAYAYFISFTLFITFVMLNLFIGVVLDGFGDAGDEEAAPLSTDQLRECVHLWSEFDPDATCYISVKKLMQFIQSLEEPLGFGRTYEATSLQLARRIRELELPILDGNVVHFRDVTAGLAKRVVKMAAMRRGEVLDELDGAMNEDFTDQWVQRHLKKDETEEVQKREEKFNMQYYYAAAVIQDAYSKHKQHMVEGGTPQQGGRDVQPAAASSGSSLPVVEV